MAVGLSFDDYHHSYIAEVHWTKLGGTHPMVFNRRSLDKMRNEQIRLVSKKLVEGISKREQHKLDRVTAELAAMPVIEDSFESLEYH